MTHQIYIYMRKVQFKYKRLRGHTIQHYIELAIFWCGGSDLSKFTII